MNSYLVTDMKRNICIVLVASFHQLSQVVTVAVFYMMFRRRSAMKDLDKVDSNGGGKDKN